MFRTHFIDVRGFDSLKQEFHLTFQEDQMIVLSYGNPMMYVDQLFGIGRDQNGFYSMDVDFDECVVKHVNYQRLSLEEILTEYESLKYDEWRDYKNKAIQFFVEKYLPQTNLLGYNVGTTLIFWCDYLQNQLCEYKITKDLDESVLIDKCYLLPKDRQPFEFESIYDLNILEEWWNE